MKWTVTSVSQKTQGYGDNATTTGFSIDAERYEGTNKFSLRVDVPLDRGHPLVGQDINSDPTWAATGRLSELV